VKRRQLLLAAAAVPFGTSLAHAQIVDINDAINKAGRQRMLSQRMAKSYFAMGQEVEPELAVRTLSASTALFDRQLVELKLFAPPAIKPTYLKLEAAWSDYKAALVGTNPSRAQAPVVLELADTVLGIAHQGTGQFEKVSGKPLGRLVNMSGRQRMLSQRMAAFYLGASWGVSPATSLAEINKARDEFLRAQQILRSAPEATDQIKSEIELADMQWTFFDAALNTLREGHADQRALSHVFTTSERILQVMDSVTGMYTALGQA
jgi:hypothetical protein